MSEEDMVHTAPLPEPASDTQDRHTPGPWHVTTCMDYWVEHAQPITEADDGFRGVAHCGDHADWPNSSARQREWEANARLIAAAPDLLDAAKCMRQHLALFCGPDDAIANWIFRFVDAAITKATGQ